MDVLPACLSSVLGGKQTASELLGLKLLVVYNSPYRCWESTRGPLEEQWAQSILPDPLLYYLTLYLDLIHAHCPSSALDPSTCPSTWMPFPRYNRQVLNVQWSSCLCILRAGFTGTHHSTWTSRCLTGECMLGVSVASFHREGLRLPRLRLLFITKCLLTVWLTENKVKNYQKYADDCGPKSPQWFR